MRHVFLMALICTLPAVAMNKTEYDLIAAVQRSNLDGIRNALARGARINIVRTGFRELPLLTIAVFRNCIRTAELLIVHGADVDMQDDDGDTPLHKAVAIIGKINPIDIVKLLLDNHANPRLKNNLNQSAYNVAEIFRNKEACELIIEKEKHGWRLAKIDPEATPSESTSSTD